MNILPTCSHKNCSVRFNLTNHKYSCSICNKYFCNAHSCNSSYLKHLVGLEYYPIDHTVSNNGHICSNCFASLGFDLVEWSKCIFERKCYAEGCDKGLIAKFKYSCVSCGKFFCSDHFDKEKKKVPGNWLIEHMNYPSADGVCVKCYSEKSAEYKEGICNSHPIADNLKLSAGHVDGDRKAIIVHGILSNPYSMDWFSRRLVKDDVFDSVWVFDDIAYTGRVNEAAKLNIGDIPLGLKEIARSGIKIVGSKIFNILNLPPYIIEGAAQHLSTVVKFLKWEDVTLIGHSLGGLVTRCAIEAFPMEGQVSTVITLGTPHKLWSELGCKVFGAPKRWNMQPNYNVTYLLMLGKDDWVTTHRSFGDLNSEDTNPPNVYKILFPQLDHSGIHSDSHRFYMSRFLKEFLTGRAMNTTEHFFVQQGAKKNYLCMTGLHGNPDKGDTSLSISDQWLEFKKL